MTDNVAKGAPCLTFVNFAGSDEARPFGRHHLAKHWPVLRAGGTQDQAFGFKNRGIGKMRSHAERNQF